MKIEGVTRYLGINADDAIIAELEIEFERTPSQRIMKHQLSRRIDGCCSGLTHKQSEQQ